MSPNKEIYAVPVLHQETHCWTQLRISLPYRAATQLHAVILSDPASQAWLGWVNSWCENSQGKPCPAGVVGWAKRPSPLRAAGMCAAVLGGSALQEMVPTFAGAASSFAVPKEPIIWRRKHAQLGVLFKFQEGELPSAFTDTRISLYQEHANIIIFLPQDHPGTRSRDWDMN